MTSFDEYLKEPCDEEGCGSAAVYSGRGRASGRQGRWCTAHTVLDETASARDD